MQASLTEAGVLQIIEKHGKEARKLISILLEIFSMLNLDL